MSIVLFICPEPSGCDGLFKKYKLFVNNCERGTLKHLPGEGPGNKEITIHGKVLYCADPIELSMSYL